MGERPLASATSSGGVVVSGTRDSLLIGELRIPWEQIENADWDPDTSLLRVAEVGTWGEQRPVHDLTLDEPGRLLELIRERVTASIVLQRHVPVRGRKGLFVIARRAPARQRSHPVDLRVPGGHRPRRSRRTTGRASRPCGRPRRGRTSLTARFRPGLRSLLTYAGHKGDPL